MRTARTGAIRDSFDRRTLAAIAGGAVGAWGFGPALAESPVLLAVLTAAMAAAAAVLVVRPQQRSAARSGSEALIDLTRPAPPADAFEVVDGETMTAAYQPIIDLATGAVVGVEALARVRDGDSLRSAEPWLRAATVRGCGVELELAAVEAALDQLAEVPPGVFLSINASPATLVSPGFNDLLADVDVSQIVVEVTEHDAIEDYVLISGALAGLRRRGLRLAVDDAGAGFSTLRHILRLRPDVIKLDLTLTQDIDTDPVQRALAAALADFGANIGASVVAEGIETARHAEVLRELGVTHGQGYGLGRPGPLSLALAGS